MELPKDEPLSVIQWMRSKERLYLVDCTTFDYSNVLWCTEYSPSIRAITQFTKVWKILIPCLDCVHYTFSFTRFVPVVAIIYSNFMKALTPPSAPPLLKTLSRRVGIYWDNCGRPQLSYISKFANLNQEEDQYCNLGKMNDNTRF